MKETDGGKEDVKMWEGCEFRHPCPLINRSTRKDDAPIIRIYGTNRDELLSYWSNTHTEKKRERERERETQRKTEKETFTKREIGI